MKRLSSLLLAVIFIAPGVVVPGAARSAGPGARVEDLRAQLIALGEREAKAQRVMGDQRARLIALNAQQAELDARRARNRADLVKLLGALEMYQRNPPPALVVSARSAKDAVRAAILIRAATPEFERRRRAFLAETAALNKVRRDAAIASAALFESESVAADRRARIDRLMAEKRALESRLGGAAPAPAASGEGDARRLQALSAPSGPLAPLPAALPSRFLAPVQGPLVRRFGQAAKGARDHDHGFAWLASPDEVVRSPAAGRIDYAGPLKGWGEVLILTLADDHHLVLAGLGAVGGVSGRSVAAGEPVGRMPPGSARDAGAGAELYLELRRGATAVDPAAWFR